MGDDSIATLGLRVSNLETDFRSLKSENLSTRLTLLQFEHSALKNSVQSLATETIKPLVAEVAALKAQNQQSQGWRGGLRTTATVVLVTLFSGTTCFLALVQTFGGH